MTCITESLESIVRRTRGYIALLKTENAELLDWQRRSVEAMKSAAFALETVAHLQGSAAFTLALEREMLPRAELLRDLIKEASE